MIVYRAKNKINNKSYIGITTKSLEHRKITHQKAAKYNNRKFYTALNKYGFDNFEWSVLDECSDMTELENKEQYYIEKYNSFNDGYNLTSGGESLKEISDESKELMREARVDWHKSNRNGFKGKTHTKQVRKRISEKLKGRVSPNKDKELSETHRENLSKAQKEWLEHNEHPNKGRTWKNKKKKEYTEVTCPYCSKSGKGPNMTRYHFKNCKKRSKKD
jgi:group I intron endonuclease